MEIDSQNEVYTYILQAFSRQSLPNHVYHTTKGYAYLSKTTAHC